MAGRVSKKPIIARIADGPPALTWRFRLAAWFRIWSMRLDDGHMIVVVTDDVHLMQLAIDGCVKLMIQKQAVEIWEANKDFLLACELQNWNPDGERPQ
jgi:hypothetical protein